MSYPNSKKQINKGLALLLNVVDDHYRETHEGLHKNFADEDWTSALRLAKQNGLLYCFLERINNRDETTATAIFESLYEAEKIKHMEFQKTVDYVETVLDEAQIDYLFIKLYRAIKYNPRDVDIIIKKPDNVRVIEEFTKRESGLKLYSDAEANIETTDLLKIDLYNGFYYFSRNFLDKDFLWRNSRKVEIAGRKCPIPSREADFASLLVHSIISHRYLSLLDFMYAHALLLSNLDFDLVVEQAKKHGWEPIYHAMINVIRSIGQDLYFNGMNVRFPIMFSPRFILRFIDLNTKRKIAFTSSNVVDLALNKYQGFQGAYNVEIPEKIHKLTLQGMRKVKAWVGDRKGITGEEIAD
jgi:hypothetical protein